ncbi:MAG: O-antigen polysaccharide polymerase Wzy family protein [Bacteroides sp.]|nr:O-antigen polysaccharide polymerase Wzy family protein [Bacteroides sp.]
MAYIFFWGGYSSLKGVYAGTERPESSLAEYIYLFTPVSLIVLVVLEMWNKTIENPHSFSRKQVNSFTLLLIIFYIFSLLVIGKRAMPLQVILTAAGLYTFFYKPLSLLRIIPLIIGGIVVMYLLAVFRDTSGSLDFQLAESLMDLIINNRNTFIAVDYVDTNGITWGKSMLAYIVSVIPFLQSAIHTVLGVDPVDMASSLIITRISLGSDDFTVGFGTNIIADLYMAWGGAGVVILMALLGYFLSWLLKKAAGSIYALTAYGVMMSYAVFFCKGRIHFPFTNFTMESFNGEYSKNTIITD